MTNAGAKPTPTPADGPGSNAARSGKASSRPGTASHPKTSGPLSGRKIGPYRVTDQIGKGGMGVVYRAHDMALDRTVAIKILPGHLSGDEEFVKRFVREARSAARLDHPNIVQVFQAGRMVSEGAGGGPGPCFIAMQYFDGQPLSELISDAGRIEPARALNVARQVAEALAAAHAAGIIHRDIKSSNILVASDDRVKVADFGLATCIAGEGRRITQTGAYLGTPEYSSPEQCEGAELDGRSDIYSLGVVLYEMLTGRVPFEAPTPLKLFDRIVHEAPEPLSRVQAGLPRELCALVGRMLAKRREDRPATAEELLSAMRRVRVALGSGKRGPGTGLRRPVASRGAGFRLAAAAASMLLLGAVAFATYRFTHDGGATPPTDPGRQAVAPVPVTPSPSPTTPTVVPPQGEDLGVVIFDLSSRFEDKDEKRLSWVRSGVPDMLITELKQCPGLAVFSRDSAAEALKSAGGHDQQAAAKKLGARLAVSGSLYAAGGKLRIDLCVSDAVTGKVAEAVKDEGTEDGIFELVNSLGRKLRVSFDSLVAAHRGQGQPLAALNVRGAEECFFLAMAEPQVDDSALAAGGGGGGAWAGKAGSGRSRSDKAEGRATREPQSPGGMFDRQGRREAAKEAAAGAVEAEAGYGHAPGATSGSPASRNHEDLKRDGDGAEVGRKLGELAEKDSAERAGLQDMDRKGLAAGGDRTRSGEGEEAALGVAAESKKAMPSAGAAPAAPAAPIKVPAKVATKGGLVDEALGAQPVVAVANEQRKAPNAAGGNSLPAASRAARVEALRHYYTGLALLDRAASRSDFSTALAELALARSLAPEMAMVDAAIERDNRGLDGTPAE